MLQVFFYKQLIKKKIKVRNKLKIRKVDHEIITASFRTVRANLTAYDSPVILITFSLF